MGVVKQLYQLQEVDLELDSNEQALKQLFSQLGESQAVVKVRTKLNSEQKRLEDLEHQQHSAEWEIDDLTNKLTPAEDKLYSGTIKNPKELTNLQHEIDALKAKRSQQEDKTLEIMDQVEAAMASVATVKSELEGMEAEWHSQQQQLSTEIEQLKATIAKLEQERQLLLADIEPKAIKLYDELKKRKGAAVAKVEQGICTGCRISLPSTDLQQARGDSLVQCSSCRRILFLA